MAFKYIEKKDYDIETKVCFSPSPRRYTIRNKCSQHNFI